jgi:hypothetical protein
MMEKWGKNDAGLGLSHVSLVMMPDLCFLSEMVLLQSKLVADYLK